MAIKTSHRPCRRPELGTLRALRELERYQNLDPGRRGEAVMRNGQATAG